MNDRDFWDVLFSTHEDFICPTSGLDWLIVLTEGACQNNFCHARLDPSLRSVGLSWKNTWKPGRGMKAIQHTV